MHGQPPAERGRGEMWGWEEPQRHTYFYYYYRDMREQRAMILHVSPKHARDISLSADSRFSLLFIRIAIFISSSSSHYFHASRIYISCFSRGCDSIHMVPPPVGNGPPHNTSTASAGLQLLGYMSDAHITHACPQKHYSPHYVVTYHHIQLLHAQAYWYSTPLSSSWYARICAAPIHWLLLLRFLFAPFHFNSRYFCSVIYIFISLLFLFRRDIEGQPRPPPRGGCRFT